MSLLDLVCPARCSGCRVPGRLVCDRCLRLIAQPPRPHVPTPCPAGMPPTWVTASYDGAVRSLLLAYKERGAVGLSRPLGAAIAGAVRAAGDPGTSLLLVPIPSSRTSVRRRGDDVVRLLAMRAARRLRSVGCHAVVASVLVQRRAVADSAGLTAQARAANLAGALSVRPSATKRVVGRKVVLIDDLVTTGATLTEATSALTRAGADVLGAAAVAATQRRGGSSS